MITTENKIIQYGSKDYIEALDIRNRILRKPLGMSIYDDPLEIDEKSYHFGTYLNGQLIGTLILTPIDTLQIKMRQVAIDEKYRGMGVGSQLVAYCEEFAKNKGYNNITLNARQKAIKFYENMGYKIISPIFIEVTLPHCKMEKII